MTICSLKPVSSKNLTIPISFRALNPHAPQLKRQQISKQVPATDLFVPSAHQVGVP